MLVDHWSTTVKLLLLNKGHGEQKSAFVIISKHGIIPKNVSTLIKFLIHELKETIGPRLEKDSYALVR